MDSSVTQRMAGSVQLPAVSSPELRFGQARFGPQQTTDIARFISALLPQVGFTDVKLAAGVLEA